MKKKTGVNKFLCGLGLVTAAATFSQTAFAGWTIAGSKILDPNGANFIYRGVNLGSAPTKDSLRYIFSDIAASGANAVRIPMYGFSGTELRYYLQLCKENKLVCVLTEMGSTGYGDLTNSSSIISTLGYWTYPEVIAVLKEYEDVAVINVANEPSGHTFPTSLYVDMTKTAISLLRFYGIKNQLMVDASTWGQDWAFAMRDNAEVFMAADTLKNVVFSIHMYEVFKDPVVIRDYLTSFTSRNLPIVIGEFAPKRKQRPGEWQNPLGTDTEVAEEAIMQIAKELNVGYLGWAWSGNPIGFTDLNIVNDYDPFRITSWGNFFINSPNGIKATSKLATHYTASSQSSSASTSSAGANRPPSAVIRYSKVQESCDNIYYRVTGIESIDPDGDTVSYEWVIYNLSSQTFEYRSGVEIKIATLPGPDYTLSLNVSDGRGGNTSTSKTLTYSDAGTCYESSLSSTSSSSSSAISSSSVKTSSSRSSSIFSSSVSSSKTSSSIRQSSSLSSVKSSSSLSSIKSSSSLSSIKSSESSSSVRSLSSSSSSRSSSSVAAAKASCTYQIQHQWRDGFTAAIRLKNISTQPINGWNVNWRYADGSSVANVWNANVTGANPYTAKNLSWNSTIQPGQTVEFGFNGKKPAVAASIPAVTGDICQ